MSYEELEAKCMMLEHENADLTKKFTARDALLRQLLERALVHIVEYQKQLDSSACLASLGHTIAFTELKQNIQCDKADIHAALGVNTLIEKEDK